MHMLVMEVSLLGHLASLCGMHFAREGVPVLQTDLFCDMLAVCSVTCVASSR